MANDTIPTGHQSPFDNWGEFNRLRFIADQAIRKIQTAIPVRVDAVTNDGGLAPVGFVDVTPLVNQIDGAGNPVPHVTIYNVPYFRLQGGANGVIIDPAVGDIGMAAFCSRDITKVKKTKARANPGSLRYHNFADGLYFGGFLNGTPTQYVQFSAAGIVIHSPVAVKLEAPTVTITAGTSCTVTTPTFTVNGQTVLNGGLNQSGGASNVQSLHSTGDVTSDADVVAGTVSLRSHDHDVRNVEPGAATITSEAPNA